METNTKHLDGVTIIAIKGSLDAMTADEALAAINGEFDKGNSQMVIDLDNVDFLSSAGMRILLASLQTARIKGGDLRLAGGSSSIRRTLDFSGFTKIMKSYESVSAAVESYGS